MSGNTRLSIIAEDGDAQPAPPIPPRAAHRPFAKRFHIGDPPRHSYEKPPPPYSLLNDATAPKGERSAAFRRNKYIARRGGWRRLCVVAFIVAALLVGLIVGLVVGLRRKHSNDNAPPSSATSSSGAIPNGPFPAGSYALTTFLDTVSTNCTSKEATWRCYPYTTYTQSQSGAMATFNWVITETDSKSSSLSSYSISSTDNPFALNFSNAPMHLLDPGLSSERYGFSVTMNKTVIPSTAIAKDNSVVTCFYNNSTFEATLYTKMPKTYALPAPASDSTASSASPAENGNSASREFQPWPYAVRVEEYIGGGNDVPSCYKTVDGDIGDRITDGISPRGPGDVCSCLYKNFEP